MKIRLTPLNIVSAILLVSIAYLILNADATGWRLLGTIPLMALALLSFISDIFFRRFLISLKRIWIIELLFIIFVAVSIIVIQKI